MLTATADLWTYTAADARVITTNGHVKADGRGVMGRGVALQATKRYMRLALILGQQLTAHGNHVAVLIAGPCPLVIFPVKHHWAEPADLVLITRSAHELVVLTDAQDWQRVLLPRPGCGNGQRTWAEVEPLLAPVLDDRFLVVTL